MILIKKIIFVLPTLFGNLLIDFSSFLLANRLLSEMARAFFISGSSQILPLPQTEKGLNSNLLKFQYLGKASFSNDLPVSTKDLQTTEFFFAANASGICRKGMVEIEKG